MPFVKYATNDLFLVSPTKEPRCPCHHLSPFSVDKILGRQKDVTWNAQGEPITVGEIDQTLAHLETSLLLYQLDFSIPEQLVFKYITTDDASFTPQHEQSVHAALEGTYGKERTIKLLHVSGLKPASSGKFSLIKQS